MSSGLTVEPDFILSIPVESKYGDNFAAKLPNMVLGAWYDFAPYKFEDKERKKKNGEPYVNTGISITDFEKNKISVTSPLGRGLMGKTEGESVKIPVPAGMLEYKILEINR